MRTFLLLTRVQMLGLLNSLAPVKSGLSHNQRTLRVVGIAAAAILLGLLFVAYLGLMAVGLALVGLARILPALAVMLGSLAGVVFTFFKANGTLFGFKDYTWSCRCPYRAAWSLPRAWPRSWAWRS